MWESFALEEITGKVLMGSLLVETPLIKLTYDLFKEILNSDKVNIVESID